MGGNALDLSDLDKDTQIADLRAEVDGLHKTMEHRAVIEQAKGVLMHSMHIGPEAAFAVLVAASMRENVKLRTIATRVVEAQDRNGATEPQAHSSP